MSSDQPINDPRNVDVQVANIGGIADTGVNFEPGVTVLSGRNATNRTSFLQALMAALGSENVSLKGDADEGTVTLDLGEDVYTRTITRSNGTIDTDGEPLLTESDEIELADLFAFLLESNEARRAVTRRDDLRELIMRPIDTDAIQNELDDLQSKKRKLDDQLEELGSLEEEIPNLEEDRTRVQEQLDEKREELASKENEIDNFDADVDETREEKQASEAKLDGLRDARNQLESTRIDIDTEEQSIEALKEERETLQSELESLSEVPAGEIQEIDAEIQRLRDQIQTINSTVTELQTVIQFNEETLDASGREVDAALNDGGTEAGSNGAVTDQLLTDEESLTCWTCGSNVQSEQIERTLDQLRDFRSEKYSTRNTLENQIDELESEKSEYKEQQNQRSRIERQLTEVETELETRQRRLADLEDKRDELINRVDELETAVEELESDEYSQILDLHKEANQLEFEINRLEDRRDELETEINSIKDQIDERAELEEKREQVQNEMQDLRTRIDRIESEAIEEFNTHMDTVLELLDYKNIERIWIERTETEVREGRRKVAKTVFDLHVVRSSESGSVYEDTIDHLSESEREVTGLVFALAGYLVHDVHEQCPFMLMDSLEALDSDRIAVLVDYFKEFAEYFVIALLPEDASGLPDGYHTVTDI